jgi:hypothetical protein
MTRHTPTDVHSDALASNLTTDSMIPVIKFDYKFVQPASRLTACFKRKPTIEDRRYIGTIWLSLRESRLEMN